MTPTRARRRRVLPSAAVVLAAALAAALPASAAEPPPPDDLFSTGADLSLYGPADSRAGWAVAPAGDVNGDGRADLLLGAPGENQAAGAAYVVFGRPRGGSPLSALADLGERGFRIAGAAPGDRTGTAVAAAQDVNGDGLGDVVVGAPGADRTDRPDAGAAYVIFGKRDGAPVSLSALGAGGYVIAGPGSGSGAGAAVAGVGDVGGDGVPDVAVGVPAFTQVRRDAGAAFVTPGHRAGGDVDLADAGVAARLDGPKGGFAGLALAAVPDLNGDRLPEIAVGAPAADPDLVDDTGDLELASGRPTKGNAYVVFGHAGTDAIDLPHMADAQGLRLRGGKADGMLGLALAGGDLDGDGTADLVVGAPQSNGERKRSGAVYVLFGASGLAGAVDLSAPGTARVLRVEGAGTDDALGAGVALPGDVTGDGVADLAATSVFADPFDRPDAGLASILAGPLAPGQRDLASEAGAPARRLAGSSAGGHLRWLAGAGDLDGDGAADLVLGEPEASVAADSGATGAGRLVFGIAPPKPEPPKPTTPDPGRVEEVKLDGCRAATRFELLIDDSGSMESSDPERLRAKGLELLLAKPGNVDRTFTAVQFGSSASKVFDATKILYGNAGDEQVRGLSAALERELIANDGGTNYNAGFRALNRAEGRADARIFLTDGEHNEGRYRDLHRGGPPTYVIALGLGGRQTAAGRRLARIARQTEGRFFPRVSTDDMQAVMNAIAAKVNCAIEFDQFVDTLTDHDAEADVNESELEDGTASADVDVTWGDPLDDVAPSDLEVVDDGAVVAQVSGEDLERAAAGAELAAGPVRITGHRGATYVSLHLTGLQGHDRLRVRVRAHGLHGATAKVRTQVQQSRRRR